MAPRYVPPPYPRVVLSPAGSGRDLPSGKPPPQPPSKIPARYRNGVWTRVPAPFSAADIAAGATTALAIAPKPPSTFFAVRLAAVWATTKTGLVYRYDQATHAWAQDPGAPSQAKRLAASGDSGTVYATGGEVGMVFIRDGKTGVWKGTLAGDAKDVAVGYQAPLSVWWISGTKLKDGGPAPVPLPDGRVAVRISATEEPLSTLWICDAQGAVLRLQPAAPAVVVPDVVATDVGAGRDGDVWAVGAVAAPNAKVDVGSGEVPAKGNELWRWDAQRALWHRVAPGWGTAVDVDVEGRAWVVDAAGKVWVHGARHLGIVPTLRERTPDIAWSKPDPVVVVQRAMENFARADGQGAGAVTLIHEWGKLADGDKTQPFHPFNLLADEINEWGVKRGFTILLQIAPIYIRRTSVPKALESAPFDDPNMAVAFFDLVDDLVAIPGFKEHVRYVCIGNEVDAFLGNEGPAWAKYAKFYAKAADYVRSKHPHVRVGVTVTWTFVNSNNVDIAKTWKPVVGLSDVASMTYYPHSGEWGKEMWTIPPKDDYQAEFPLGLLEKVDKHGGGKLLVLQEIGFPSDATYCGSSAQAQADFVLDVLANWAWNPAASRIAYLGWFALHDMRFNPDWKGPPDPDFGRGNAFAYDVLNGAVGTSEYRRLGAYFSSCGLFNAEGQWKQPVGKVFLTWARLLATQTIFELPKG